VEEEHNRTTRIPVEPAVRDIVKRAAEIQGSNINDFVAGAALEEAQRTIKVKEQTGAVLIGAMQSSPHRDIDVEPERERMPVSNPRK
jgi:uncharacterized protein (DUF1778 family)